MLPAAAKASDTVTIALAVLATRITKGIAMKRLTLIMALAAAFAAHASDGVIEINHAKIMANGGYPYTISQPGSYRLTSNLKQPDKDTTVLFISADRVTLDLNGFVIQGSNICSYSAGSVTCNASGVGYGVASNNTLVTVKNGALGAIAGDAIYLSGTNSLVESVGVAECGGTGITASTVGHAQVTTCIGAGIVSYGEVAHSRAEKNGQAGIQANRISHSSAVQNGGFGFQARSVSHSESNYNAGDGIVAPDRAVFVGNRISGNGGGGIKANGWYSLSTQNVLDGNAGGNTIGPIQSLPANSNLCDNTPC